MCTKENQIQFSLTAEEIQSKTDDLIARMNAVGDEVAKVEGKRTFENTIAPLARMDREMSPLISSCDFPMHVSADSKLRDVSCESDEKLRKFSVDFGMREDVYKAVKEYDEQRQAEEVQLGTEAIRYIERTLRDFKRNGLALDAAKREKAMELQKKISEKEVAFQKNLGEDTTKIAFTKEELEGLPDDFIENLQDAEDGKKWVTLKYPDVFPCMQKAKREETRKAIDQARTTQCQEMNTPLLEDTLLLRQELAELLGYNNHADFKLEVRMAKKNQAVDEMYDKLCPRLIPFAKKEIEVLLDLKAEDKKERGEPFDGKINSWDFMYYNTMLKQKQYSVDEDIVKQYFPLNIVKDALLAAYQEILTLTFVQVENPSDIWHADVEQFEVYDKTSNDFLGYFYLDLFPREGKYGHAACFGLQVGCDQEPTANPVDGCTRQCSVAAMVANFTKPTATKPSLLQHNEVVTFFHEFGHVMHQICTKARYAQFAGTSTERDFVEAPSQMLENWCWEAEPLKKMSGHYEDSTKKLPEDLLKNMLDAKNLNSGLLNLRQVFFGKFDLTIHKTKGKVDTTALWTKLREEVSLIPNSSGGNGAASFGHIMGGYDAGYYGYLWSEVFSADMFTVFKEGNQLYSPDIGGRYRRSILEVSSERAVVYFKTELVLRLRVPLQPGGTVDGGDMIKNFLQRELDPDAFLISIGLQP